MGRNTLGKCTLIILNQMRADLAAKYAGAVSWPGGHAAKHFPKVRLILRALTTDGRIVVDAGKTTERVLGNTVRGIVDKNNTGHAAPYQRFEYQYRYGLGVDHQRNLVDVAKAAGIVRPRGAWVFVDVMDAETGTMQEMKFNGAAKMAEHLVQHPEFAAALEQHIRETMKRPLSETVSAAAPTDDTEDESSEDSEA
mgnify:FL=1